MAKTKTAKRHKAKTAEDYIPDAMQRAEEMGHQLGEFRGVWWIRDGLSATCQLCKLAMEIRINDWPMSDGVRGGAFATKCPKKPYKV